MRLRTAFSILVVLGAMVAVASSCLTEGGVGQKCAMQQDAGATSSFAEGASIVEPSFECLFPFCVSTAGSEGYCTKVCTGVDECPEEFDCKQLIRSNKDKIPKQYGELLALFFNEDGTPRSFCVRSKVGKP